MRLTCTKNDLHRGIQVAGRAAPGRTNLPILYNVLLHAEGETLTLTCYDQEVGIQVSVPARVEEAGEGTAPARLFAEVIGDLPEADVSIAADEKHNLAVTCQKSKFNLAGLSPDEFPRLPEVGEEIRMLMPTTMLREIVKQTIFCVADDESRPALTGVNFRLAEGKLTAAATDTHRLSIRDAQPPEMAGETEVIVPQRALDQFMRALPTEKPGAKEEEPEMVEIRIARNQALLKARDVTVVSRLIEGPFPNYERVVPAGYQKLLVLEREPFLRAVRRVAILAKSDKASRLVIRAAGGEDETTVQLSAESSGLGRAYEEVDASIEGEDVELAFNCSYLQDVLGVLEGPTIRMEISGHLTPCIVRATGETPFRYILMPMQIA